MPILLGLLLVAAAVVVVAGVYAWIAAVRMATDEAAARSEPERRELVWALESRSHAHAEPSCHYCRSTGHSTYYHHAG